MITKMVCIKNTFDITKDNIYIVQTKTDYFNTFHVLNDKKHWKYYPSDFFEPLRKANLKKILCL